MLAEETAEEKGHEAGSEDHFSQCVEVSRYTALMKERFCRKMNPWLSVMGICYFREVTEW